MAELVQIGGIQPLMKELLNAGLLHGDCLTVTGKTLAENLADVKDYPEYQDMIGHSTIPSKKIVISPFFMATLLPKVQLPKLPAKKAWCLRVKPKYLTRKKQR